jgi:hypothetical protein
MGGGFMPVASLVRLLLIMGARQKTYGTSGESGNEQSEEEGEGDVRTGRNGG